MINNDGNLIIENEIKLPFKGIGITVQRRESVNYCKMNTIFFHFTYIFFFL